MNTYPKPILPAFPSTVEISLAKLKEKPLTVQITDPDSREGWGVNLIIEDGTSNALLWTGANTSTWAWDPKEEIGKRIEKLTLTVPASELSKYKGKSIKLSYVFSGDFDDEPPHSEKLLLNIKP